METATIEKQAQDQAQARIKDSETTNRLRRAFASFLDNPGPRTHKALFVAIEEYLDEYLEYYYEVLDGQRSKERPW